MSGPLTAPPATLTGREHDYACWTVHPECALRAALDLAATRRDQAAAAARRYSRALALCHHAASNPWFDTDPRAAPAGDVDAARELLTAHHAEARVAGNRRR